MRMFGGGIPNKQIAQSLDISYSTVLAYVKRGKDKLRAQGFHYVSKMDIAQLIDEGVF